MNSNNIPTMGHLHSVSTKVKEEQSAILNTCNSALTEMSGVKQSKPVTGTVTVGTTVGSAGSTNVWIPDNDGDYLFYYDIPVSNITSDFIADIIILNGSQGTALACGLSSVSETLAGVVRIRSYSVPEASMELFLRIFNATVPTTA